MSAKAETNKAVEYAQKNAVRFVDELKALLRIPSVSTAPEHVADVRKAAEFTADGLRAAGMENVRLIETSTDKRKGHPLVYADWLHAGAGKPTVLCYGHYDVQPAEPLDEWKSPPFEPEERNGNIYARGAVDDKGQMWMHMKALESLLKAEGKLPCNIKVIVEGEEEVGGEGIAAFVREHGDVLKADAALVSDTEMFAPELPTLCVGLRGMIYTELEVKGAMTDLHSGMYGGAAPNPFVALAQIIAKLKDEDGHIAIPGFYDGIEAPTADELKAWKSLPFDEEHYRKTEVGSTELTGEPKYSVLERTWSRPTMDVHGMPGGFIGAGAKTVIPAKAVAKISFRLVPGMKPEETFAKYKKFVEEIAPRGVQVSVRMIHSGEPIVVSTDNEYIRAATKAMAEVFGKETVFVRGGGSIPIVGDFVRELGVPTVMMGFGLPDDNLHAPNEKFHLANFHRGIESIVRFFGLVGEGGGVSTKLPVHGFVLAGGKSSRMGTDKALLKFRGRPLIEIAVEKLRGFCAEVSIAGNREDLRAFAPVVPEVRVDCGPAAGIEAGLKAAKQGWAMFVPVDVPLVPGELLQRWAEEVLHMANHELTVSHLSIETRAHPTFCMLRRDCVENFSKVLDSGERKLSKVFELVGKAEGFDWIHDLRELSSNSSVSKVDRWFMNINTPQDLAEAEADPL